MDDKFKKYITSHERFWEDVKLSYSKSATGEACKALYNIYFIPAWLSWNVQKLCNESESKTVCWKLCLNCFPHVFVMMRADVSYDQCVSFMELHHSEAEGIAHSETPNPPDGTWRFSTSSQCVEITGNYTSQVQHINDQVKELELLLSSVPPLNSANIGFFIMQGLHWCETLDCFLLINPIPVVFNTVQ